MGTAKKLGREEHGFEVIRTAAAADLHTGRYGTITLTMDPDEEALIDARLHDGHTAGGFKMAAEAATSVAGMLANAKAVPAIDAAPAAAGDTQAINHQLGYEPLVTVVDTTDGSNVTDFKVDHTDDENVVITFDTAGTYKVYLR